MAFTHGLAPYPLEDKDIIRVHAPTIHPKDIGYYWGNPNQHVWALTPQAQVSRVDFSKHCVFDILIPPHDWYRGPLWLFTTTCTGGVMGNTNNCSCHPLLMCPGKLYGFVFDQGGSLDPDGKPFDPNIGLVLNEPDTWLTIHPGVWYYV